MPKKVPDSAPSGSSNASSNGGSATKAAAKVKTALPPRPSNAAAKKSTSTTGSTTSKFKQASPAVASTSSAYLLPVELRPALFTPPGYPSWVVPWKPPPGIPYTYEAQEAEYWRGHAEAAEEYRQKFMVPLEKLNAEGDARREAEAKARQTTDLDDTGRPRRSKGMHPALADFDTTSYKFDPAEHACLLEEEHRKAVEKLGPGAVKRTSMSHVDEEEWTAPKPAKRRKSSIMPAQHSVAAVEPPVPIQETPMDVDDPPSGQEQALAPAAPEVSVVEDEEPPRATTGGKTLSSMVTVARPSREDTPEEDDEGDEEERPIVPVERSPAPPAPRSPSLDLAPNADDGFSLGSSRASSSGFVIKLVRSTPKAGKAASPAIVPSASPTPPSPAAAPHHRPAEPVPPAAAQDPTPSALQVVPSPSLARHVGRPLADVAPPPISAATPSEVVVAPPTPSAPIYQGAPSERTVVASPSSRPLSRIASELAAPSSPSTQQRGATPSALDQLDAFFGIEEIAPTPSVTPRLQQTSVAPSPPIAAPSYTVSTAEEHRRLPPPPRPRRPSSLPRARKPSPLTHQPSPLRQVDTPPLQATSSTAQTSPASRRSTRAPPQASHASSSVEPQTSLNGSMPAPPLPSGLVAGALSFTASQNGADSPSDLSRLASGLASDPFAQYIASQQAAHLEAQNPNLDFGYETDIGSITRNASPAISASASSKASTPVTGAASLYPPPPPPAAAPAPTRSPASGGKGKGKADAPAKGKKKKRASKASAAADEGDKEQPVCSHCGTTTSPLFRRDPGTGLYICNVSSRLLSLPLAGSRRRSSPSSPYRLFQQACGLYFKAHGHHRPINVVSRAIGPQRIIKRKAAETSTNKNVTIFIDDTPKVAKKPKTAAGGAARGGGGEGSGSSSGGGGATPVGGGGGARGPPSLFQPMPQLTFQAPYNPHVNDDYNSTHYGPNPQQSPPSSSGAIKPTSTAALNGTTLAGLYIHRNDSPFDPSQLRKQAQSPFDLFEGGAEASCSGARKEGGGAGGSTSSTSASASASTTATSHQDDGVGASSSSHLNARGGGANAEGGGGSGTPSHQPGVEREYGGVLSFASEVEFWESQAFGRGAEAGAEG